MISVAHINLILSLNYLVHFRSRRLVICNNEFVLLFWYMVYYY